MREYVDNILQEIDSEIDNFDFYDCDIIENSLKMVRRLRDILDELKKRMKGHAFNTKEEEVMFFKRQKPALLGRLIYFHKILRIESQRPFDTAELDKYYEKQQEEQNYSSTAMWHSFNTIAAEAPILMNTISCVGSKTM